MPSSAGYRRDYKQEAKYHASPEQKKRRAMRNKAHRTLERVLGRNIKGDVDHKTPLSKGGSNSRSNLRVQSKSANRSYARTSSGAIK
jgi:5-methylcytosine-specific restriction endonuclease McrA